MDMTSQKLSGTNFKAHYGGPFSFPSPTHGTSGKRRGEHMKMEQQPGNIVTQFFAWLATIAGVLGWTTQDLVYFIFGFIGVVISLASYINGRIDARAARKEDQRRTKIMEDYIADVKKKPLADRPSAVEVISEAADKAEANG